MRLRSLSFRSKRIIFGALLAVILAAEGNWYFRWHLFGRADELVVNSSLVAGALLYLLMGPSVAETRDYRERTRRARRP